MTVHLLSRKTSLGIYYFIAYVLLASMPLLKASNGITLTFLTKKDVDGSLVNPSQFYNPERYQAIDIASPAFDKRTYVIQEKKEVWPTLLQLVEDLHEEGIDSPIDLDFNLVSEPTATGRRLAEGKPFFKIRENDIKPNTTYYILAGKKKGVKNITISFTIDNKTLLENENFKFYESSTTYEDVWPYVLNYIEDNNIAKDILKEPLVTLKYRENNSHELKEINARICNAPETIQDLNIAEIIFSRPKKQRYFYINHDGSLITDEQFNDMKQVPLENIRDEFKCIEVPILQGNLVWPIINNLVEGIPAKNMYLATIGLGDDQLLAKRYESITKFRVHHEEHFMLMYRKPLNETIKCTLKKEGDPAIIKKLEVPLYKYNTFLEVYLHLLTEAGYQVDKKAIAGTVIYEEISFTNGSETIATESVKQAGYVHFPGLFSNDDISRIKNKECTFIMPATTQLRDNSTPEHEINNQDESREDNSLDNHYSSGKWINGLIIRRVAIVGILVVATLGYIAWKIYNKKKQYKKIASKQLVKLPKSI